MSVSFRNISRYNKQHLRMISTSDRQYFMISSRKIKHVIVRDLFVVPFHECFPFCGFFKIHAVIVLTGYRTDVILVLFFIEQMGKVSLTQLVLTKRFREFRQTHWNEVEGVDKLDVKHRNGHRKTFCTPVNNLIMDGVVDKELCNKITIVSLKIMVYHDTILVFRGKQPFAKFLNGVLTLK